MTHSLGQGRKREGHAHSWGQEETMGRGTTKFIPGLQGSSEQQDVCSPEHITAARSNDGSTERTETSSSSEKGEKQKEAQQH